MGNEKLREALETMKAVAPTVGFYLKREINAPANHQEFAQEAAQKLHRFNTALEKLEAALAAEPPATEQHLPGCDYQGDGVWNCCPEHGAEQPSASQFDARAWHRRTFQRIVEPSEFEIRIAELAYAAGKREGQQ